MKGFFKKVERLLMASTYLEANARQQAEQCLEEGFGKKIRPRKRMEERKERRDYQQDQQRLRL